MIKLRAEWRRVKEGGEIWKISVLGPGFRLSDSKGIGFYACVCRCVCGSIFVTKQVSIESGHTRSCGCFHDESAAKTGVRNLKHGLSRDPLFNCWRQLKSRCLNQNDANFKDYGGRGITVFQEWIDDFEAFKKWALSHGYKRGLRIDREKNDLGYSPDNCRFVTHKVNQNNRRNNVILTMGEETKTLAQWSEDSRCVVCRQTFSQRIRAGWEIATALSTPARRRKK